MSTEHEELTAAYLAELEREAARLPWNARAELLEDVRSHIEVALAEMGAEPGASQIRAMLGALGEPREIVGAALADTPSEEMPPVGMPSADMPTADMSTAGTPFGGTPFAEPPYPLSGQEICAILLLLVGGFLIGVGWIAGVLLLWNGRRWTTREKIIGTLVVPGGYFAIWYFLATPAPGGVVLPPWLSFPLIAFLLVGPLASAIFLFRNARRSPSAYPATRRSIGHVILGVLAGIGALMIAGGAVFVVAGTSSGSSHPGSGSGEVTTVPVPASSQPASR